MTLVTPLHGHGLVLNGHHDGLLQQGLPRPSGDRFYGLKMVWVTGSTPPRRAALWLWYLCKYLSSTIVKAIYSGAKLPPYQRGLRRRITVVQLVM